MSISTIEYKIEHIFLFENGWHLNLSMRPLEYKTYCVKCGEFNHNAHNCKNIDESKMMNMLNNHQISMMKTVYGTFPALSSDINKNGEYECKNCNRTFRKYKYFMYHNVYHGDICVYSKVYFPHSPYAIVLK